MIFAVNLVPTLVPPNIALVIYVTVILLIVVGLQESKE